MPLPTGDMLWPPKALDDIMPKLDEWSAWYAGDGEGLTRVYRTRGERPAPSVRRAQLAGGIVGRVARWFWGQPTPSNEQRTKLHVPVAADIATASSDLLFSEVPKLKYETAGMGESTPNTDRLEMILDGNSWSSLLPETAEVCSALGGGYLRVTWDAEIARYPLITTMHTDQAWPEFRYGRLWAVTFWQVLEINDQQVIRHLERHERGRIEHGLFMGTPTQLGRRVPITEHPATADITVNAESAILTGEETPLTAVYVPNIRPQRRWRQHPTGRNLGRPDVDGVEHLMDALDETYTSWMRDIRLGKGRVLAPSYMLESNGPGQGAGLDLDQEVFTTLNMPPTEDGKAGLTVQQFQIRTQEHADTARDLLEQILRGAGYFPDVFGLGDSAAMTATEVDSRGRKSNLTREKKTRYWDNAIADLIEALTAVDVSIFQQGERLRPTVEFQASVSHRSASWPRRRTCSGRLRLHRRRPWSS